MGVRVFLDIDIGDRELYEQEVEQHERATTFLKQSGAGFGLPSDINDLSDEQRETAADLYGSDPSWSSKGDARFTAPKSIRAGRIVFELFDDKVRLKEFPSQDT